ncbi:MAG: hypothetical protein ACI9W6_000484 [Motiliproteus sp.]|jgi:hypothetical protein
MKTIVRVCLGLLLALPLILPLAPLQAEEVRSSADDEITIRPGDKGELYYEYRINGAIKEIRVVPEIGKPYYLVPADGQDGSYIRMDGSQLLIPKWVLFRW